MINEVDQSKNSEQSLEESSHTAQTNHDPLVQDKTKELRHPRFWIRDMFAEVNPKEGIPIAVEHFQRRYLTNWNASRPATILYMIGVAAFFTVPLAGQFAGIWVLLALVSVPIGKMWLSLSKKREPSIKIRPLTKADPVQHSVTEAVRLLLEEKPHLACGVIHTLNQQLKSQAILPSSLRDRLFNNSYELAKHLDRIKTIETFEKKKSSRAMMSKGLLRGKSNQVLEDLINVARYLDPEITFKDKHSDRRSIVRSAGLFCRWLYQKWEDPLFLSGSIRGKLVPQELNEKYLRSMMEEFSKHEAYRLKKMALQLFSPTTDKKCFRLAKTLDRRMKLSILNATRLSPNLRTPIISAPKVLISSEGDIRYYNAYLKDDLDVEYVTTATLSENPKLKEGVLNLSKKLYAPPFSQKLKELGGMTVHMDEAMLESFLNHDDSELIVIIGPSTAGRIDVVGMSIIHRNETDLPLFAREIVDSLPNIGRKGFLTFIGVDPELSGLRRKSVSQLAYTITELLFAGRVDVVYSQIGESNDRSKRANFWDPHAAIGDTGQERLSFVLNEDNEIVPHRFKIAIRLVDKSLRQRILDRKTLINTNLTCAMIKDDLLLDCFKEQIRYAASRLEQSLSSRDEEAHKICYQKLITLLGDGFYFVPDELFGSPYLPTHTSNRLGNLISKIDRRTKVGFPLIESIPQLLSEVRREFGFG